LSRRTSSPPFWSSPFPVPLRWNTRTTVNRQLDSMLYRTVGSKIRGVNRCQNHVLRRRPFSKSRSRHPGYRFDMSRTYSVSSRKLG
jgi:hypothetical protein